MSNNNQLKCVGGIIGDIIGQRFEFRQKRQKTKDFQLYTVDSRFTDDTVMTCAIMDWLVHGIKSEYTEEHTGIKEPFYGIVSFEKFVNYYAK